MSGPARNPVPGVGLAALLLVAAVGAAPAAEPLRAVPEPSQQRLNEFEWIGPAPIVTVARSRGRNGKAEEFLVEQVLRGELPAGEVVGVLVKRANRWRSEHAPHERLQIEPGARYVLLLEPAERADRDDRFELVRGVQGARRLPAEGAPAVVEALERFVAIQDRGDHDHTWREMRAMLEADRPLLLATALEQHVKFRRGDVELIPTLLPLLDHPLPGFRALATRLAASILERHGDGPLPGAAPLRGELIARARRDADPGVRVEATRALDRLPGEAIDEVLEQISRDDPAQQVRYAAERLLWERRRRQEGPGGGDGPGRADGSGARPGAD